MEIKWYLWILLFIIVVLVFPKPCGTKIPSKVLDYTCVGFETPYMSTMQKSEYRENWCSGICTSKLKVSLNNTSSNNATQEAPGPLGGITDTFTNLVPALFLIFGIIIVANFINSVQKKAGGGSITIVKGPGQ